MIITAIGWVIVRKTLTTSLFALLTTTLVACSTSGTPLPISTTTSTSVSTSSPESAPVTSSDAGSDTGQLGPTTQSDDASSDSASSATEPVPSSDSAAASSGTNQSWQPDADVTQALQDGGWTSIGSVLLSTNLTSDGNVNAFIVPGVGLVDVPDAELRGDDADDLHGTRFTTVGTGASLLLVALTQAHIPASGLDPERWESRLVVIDPRTGQAARRVDLGQSPHTVDDLKLTGTPAGSRVAAMVNVVTSGDADSDSPDPVYQVLVIDASSGTIVSRTTGTLRGTVAGGYSVEIPHPNKDRSGEDCDEIVSYALDSGKELGRLDAKTLPRNALGQCAGVDADSDPGAQDQDRSSRVVWLTSTLDAVQTVHATFDGVTGAPLTLPYSRLAGAYLVDEGRGQAVNVGSGDPVTVSDLSTGKALFSVSKARSAALVAAAKGLHDGKLYLGTTDALVVVDVASGDVVDEHADRYPKAVLDGGYIWWSDDTIG